MKDPSSVTVTDRSISFVKLSEILETLTPETRALVNTVVWGTMLPSHPNGNQEVLHLVPLLVLSRRVQSASDASVPVELVVATVRALRAIRNAGMDQGTVLVDLLG
jgi:hypothetical protein